MSAEREPVAGAAFLAFPQMKSLLVSELQERLMADLSGRKDYGDLLCLPGYSLHERDVPYWCRTALKNPFLLRFDSIGDAAAELRGMQRSWAPYGLTCFRRTALIQEKLPYVNLKSRDFPFEIPRSPIGIYTLLDEHTMLASADTTSCLPLGTVTWNEDHINPPSRAYLKLQEALVLARHFFGAELPGPGTTCFEAGACPGGWTWVLANSGASILAVDRAPLAQSLMENPLVTFRAHDAFTLAPEEIGQTDWVLSDVICYPERLLQWTRRWLSSGLTKNMICTIKMQGKINWQTVREFESIPHSRVVHLNYNKHELTFIHCEKSGENKIRAQACD